ncbi:MAG: hypothetical protein JNL58_10800 [Planctomyces sp.]|nr:hypothetical protein [Planctomyces sp.]
MNWPKHVAVVVVTIFLLTASNLSEAAKPPAGGGGGTTTSYRTVPLSSSEGLVQAVNGSGEMVGYVQGPMQAQHWTVSDTNVVISTTLDSDLVVGDQIISFDSGASDINDQGFIVGALGFYEFPDQWRPVIWNNKNGPARELPIPQGTTGEAYGISNQPLAFNGLKAVVVGRFIDRNSTPDPVTYAVAWGILDDQNFTITQPVILDVGMATPEITEYETVAMSINSSLAVVGVVEQMAHRWQLSLNWNNSTPVFSVTSTTALFPSAASSTANAINDSGDICGEASGRAYLLENVNGVLTNRTLPLLVNTSRTSTTNVLAAALDDSATPKVLGAVNVFRKSSGIIDRFYAPVLWQGTNVVDLEKSNTTTGLSPNYPTDINNSGWIVGNAWTGSIHIPAVLIPQ